MDGDNRDYRYMLAQTIVAFHLPIAALQAGRYACLRPKTSAEGCADHTPLSTRSPATLLPAHTQRCGTFIRASPISREAREARIQSRF